MCNPSETINPNQSQLRSLLPLRSASYSSSSNSLNSETRIGLNISHPQRASHGEWILNLINTGLQPGVTHSVGAHQIALPQPRVRSMNDCAALRISSATCA